MNKTTIPRKNTIWVGADSGENPLIAAKTAAVSGDTIIVTPGTYNIPFDSQLFKDGVNWHFMAGAIVTKTNVNPFAGDAYGIFDDRDSGAVACSITGNGVFDWTAGNSNNAGDPGTSTLRGTVTITNASSVVSIEADKILVGGYYFPSNRSEPNCAAVWIDDASQVKINCDYIEDKNYDDTVDLGGGPIESTAYGIYWRWGNTSIEAKRIRGGYIGIVAYQKTGATGSANLNVKADRVEQWSQGHCISIEAGTLSTWRTNFDIGTLFAESANCDDIINVGGGGEHHINALEVLSPLATVSGITVNGSAGGSPLVWASFGTTSTPEFVFIVGTVAQGTPICHFHCDYANQTANGQLAYLGRGETFMTGGVWKTAGAKGILHLGGVSRVRGITVNTSAADNAAYRCFEVSSSGLIIDGCTMIAPASADSIYSAGAQTVKIYGTSYTNKAKNANITVQAGLGTLVADSNVS